MTQTATQPMDVHDPYQLNSTFILEPPTTFAGKLKHLGPGFVLSAAIVGSGELIATTTLGARAGLVTFWVVLVSCLVKVTLQMEFGKHVIHTGEPTMLSFNRLPGPRLGKASWTIWAWLLIQVFKLLQVGGIVGGVAITLQIVMPGLPAAVWALIVTTLTSVLVYRGYYRTVERLSLLMVVAFTVFTLSSVFFLQFTPYALTTPEVLGGLQFGLPPETVGIAIAAFGITGVGGDEIMYYNYWCLEKGYAAYTGPKEDTVDWQRRAKGWISVMYLDAFVAMVVYTLVTAAFYLLGAAVLHNQGAIPEGYGMINTLSGMYTETLGPWAKSVFLFGALVVLYSTLFTATASWTRIYADAFAQMGLFDFTKFRVRRKVTAWMAWLFPLVWAALFIFIRLPVIMVLLGGFVTSILLLLVVYAAIYFRYYRLPVNLKPGKFYDLALWISVVSIVMVGIYGIIQTLP